MNGKRLPIAASILCIVLVAPVATTAAEETVIVVHRDTPVEQLTSDQLKKIYLGTTAKLAGSGVKLTMLSKGGVHQEFTTGFLAKTPSQFVNHWRRLVFSGKGKLPRTFDSEAELLAFVSSTPGAIGYVSAATAHPGVKEVGIE